MLHSDGARELARPHLALGLDLPDAEAALALARQLRPWFAVAKVGLELFTSEGPPVVRRLLAEELDVFLDLKLHDIPTTVGRGAGRAAALGARYVTVHAAGGEAMLRAAVEGYESVRAAAGDPPRRAGILAVTVLTSEPAAMPEVLAERTSLAAATGCAGVVCAAPDLAVVREARAATGSELTLVVPGIRLEGSRANDQARIATPGSARAAGADLLVIGRTVTDSPEPAAAAEAVAESFAVSVPR